LDDLDRPEHTKQMQRNWIGRSEGAYVTFHVSEERFIEIYTTRVDTIYGVTAIVLAPENTSLDDMIDEDHMKNLEVYRSQTRAKTAVERQQ
jgi:leucyl-tRNA synthetase